MTFRKLSSSHQQMLDQSLIRAEMIKQKSHMTPRNHHTASVMSPKDITFGNVTLQCLCRRPGELPQKCWTLQNEPAAHGTAFPAQTVDDIGLDIWPASEVLCRFLTNHPALAMRATSVLELGAGVGLPGLLAALLGEALLMLTDYDPQVLEVLQCNIDSNSLSDRGRVHQIHWKTWRGEPDFGYFELVLGADLLYASAVVKDFVEVLKHVLAPEGVFLMAHQIRRSILLDPKTTLPRLEEFDAPLELFKRFLTDAGLHMRELLVLSPEEADSTSDSEFCVLAVGWTETTLNNMPL